MKCPKCDGDRLEPLKKGSKWIRCKDCETIFMQNSIGEVVYMKIPFKILSREPNHFPDGELSEGDECVQCPECHEVFTRHVQIGLKAVFTPNRCPECGYVE